MTQTKVIPFSSVKNFYKDIPISSDGDLVRKSYNVKAIDNQGDNLYKVLISCTDIDRDGEVLLIDGIDTDYYNNVILWNHDLTDLSIGLMQSMTKSVNELYGTFKFSETYSFAQDIKGLVDEKMINGISIGYIPLESVTPKDSRFKYLCNKYGIDSKKCVRILTKVEMIECSLCTVACNRKCRIIKGMSEKGLQLCQKSGIVFQDKLESKSQKQEKKNMDMEIVSKLETIVTAMAQALEALKPKDVEIEVEETPINDTTTLPKEDETKAVADMTGTVVANPAPNTDQTVQVPKEQPKEEDKGCGKPKEETKSVEQANASEQVETKAVEPPKPIEIKVLRVGGLQSNDEIRAKALKYLAGKPF